MDLGIQLDTPKRPTCFPFRNMLESEIFFFPLGVSIRRFIQNKSSGKKSIGKMHAPTLPANYYSQ